MTWQVIIYWVVNEGTARMNITSSEHLVLNYAEGQLIFYITLWSRYKLKLRHTSVNKTVRKKVREGILEAHSWLYSSPKWRLKHRALQHHYHTHTHTHHVLLLHGTLNTKIRQKTELVKVPTCTECHKVMNVRSLLYKLTLCSHHIGKCTDLRHTWII